jgi:hypothetical protein
MNATMWPKSQSMGVIRAGIASLGCLWLLNAAKVPHTRGDAGCDTGANTETPVDVKVRRAI